jgi:hypothetical protein
MQDMPARCYDVRKLGERASGSAGVGSVLDVGATREQGMGKQQQICKAKLRIGSA